MENFNQVWLIVWEHVIYIETDFGIETGKFGVEVIPYVKSQVKVDFEEAFLKYVNIQISTNDL